jgi:hypothetical protein
MKRIEQHNANLTQRNRSVTEDLENNLVAAKNQDQSCCEDVVAIEV